MSDTVDFIIRYEGGEVTDDEVIENFQRMIDDGSVWGLQGSYGRFAAYLIEQGYCSHAKQQHTDYWGNKLPVAAD